MKIKIPKHVAIIMDGNGRWATERGLKRSKGHEAGYKNLRKLAVHILKKGTKYLSVYAFSTENFNRSDEEVNFLMDMFVKKFKSEKDYFNKYNVKVIFSGRKKPLRKDVLSSMDDIVKSTEKNTDGVFNICINYGGRTELIDAAKKIALDYKENNLDLDSIDESVFNSYLYNDLPPVDFLIRTSGELRISNFMLYQISYSEMYFPKLYFPDFDNEKYDKSIIEFTKRDRRFGKVK